MEKSILNLLSNAFKFTDQGGVYISITEDDGRLELRVRDTGIGIPEDKLKTVFERFSQVDGTASRKFEGTGIGLATAQRIVHHHRGRIWAEAEVGSGATFFFTLPNT